LACSKKTIVIGVGNILMSDEGLGVRAAERLQKIVRDENIKIIDAGTSLQRALTLTENFEKIIIIDAVRADKPAGHIQRFTIEELEQGKTGPVQLMLSLHEIDVPKAIAMERLVAKLPEEIIFFGMEPEKIAPGMELSRAVEAKMDLLVSAIRKELEK
jgi:hydrogenase maturation protease